MMYYDHLDQVLPQLPKGAFLTVKNQDEVNTMVIGWGNIGFIWGKKVFTVYVRYTRHTFQLLDQAKEFTISVPIDQDLKDALMYCGTKSGKDENKIKNADLSLVSGRKINTPIIGDCLVHYECKVIYEDNIRHSVIDSSVRDKYYRDNDYHVVYYGEIVDCYLYKK